jgi:hypothetical protein
VLLANRRTRKAEFTRLYAKVEQADGAFTVTVRLENHLSPKDAAWGEEIAPSVETASSMIAALAAELDIPQNCISIQIRMEDIRRHLALNIPALKINARTSEPG